MTAQSPQNEVVDDNGSDKHGLSVWQALLRVNEHLIIHRLVAFGFDMVLCLQCSAIFFVILFPHLNQYLHFPESSFFFLYFLFSSYILWAYYVITEASYLNGSLGKRIIGLRVVTSQGSTLSIAQSTLRSILAPVSLVIGGCGFAMAAMNKYHLAWHDLRTTSRVMLLRDLEDLHASQKTGTQEKKDI